jgi:mono/diheme cytochrome c family protein
VPVAPRIAVIVLLVSMCAGGIAGCRPHARGARGAAAAGDPRVARGAVLYAGYCAGCHGSDGAGDGPVAYTLHLSPADLRAPGLLAGASDGEVAARILHGDALPTAPRGSAFATERQVAALEEYVLALDGRPWERLRAGRFVYEGTCGPCHGAYGTGEGVIGAMLGRPPASLPRAAARHTDASLAALIRGGAGAMVPFGDLLSPEEIRQVVAYVRLLSPGHRVYDTYCASCHGDDGRGVDAEDALPPAMVAPPLEPRRLAAMPAHRRRAAVLHMLERERGLMPHFRDTLDERELGDIVAYLRASM